MTTDQENGPFPDPPHALPGLGGVMSNLGDRVQEILDAAERAAGEIRAEAEAAGVRDREERRREVDRMVAGRLRELREITDGLSRQAASVRREADALVQEIEYATQRMAILSEAPAGPDLPQVEADPVTPLKRFDSEELRRAGTDGATNAERLPEPAVLRATQMAVAGSERSEIERMLRTDFGIREPAPLVDEMLRTERA